MHRAVEIQFQCLPLRSIGGCAPPLDASPKFRAKCERIFAARNKHGAFNTYYLHDAWCRFHLSNNASEGMLEFSFEGLVATDTLDRFTVADELHIELTRETCDWLTAPIVAWFKETVVRAVRSEFDRYVSERNDERTQARIANFQAELDRTAGFIGMGL